MNNLLSIHDQRVLLLNAHVNVHRDNNIIIISSKISTIEISIETLREIVVWCLCIKDIYNLFKRIQSLESIVNEYNSLAHKIFYSYAQRVEAYAFVPRVGCFVLLIERTNSPISKVIGKVGIDIESDFQSLNEFLDGTC